LQYFLKMALGLPWCPPVILYPPYLPCPSHRPLEGKWASILDVLEPQQQKQKKMVTTTAKAKKNGQQCDFFFFGDHPKKKLEHFLTILR
jgi:hypothetical protein